MRLKYIRDKDRNLWRYLVDGDYFGLFIKIYDEENKRNRGICDEGHPNIKKSRIL